MEKKRGRIRVYASAADRHRAYRLRLGIKVRKAVNLAESTVCEGTQAQEADPAA